MVSVLLRVRSRSRSARWTSNLPWATRRAESGRRPLDSRSVSGSLQWLGSPGVPMGGSRLPWGVRVSRASRRSGSPRRTSGGTLRSRNGRRAMRARRRGALSRRPEAPHRHSTLRRIRRLSRRWHRHLVRSSSKPSEGLRPRRRLQLTCHSTFQSTRGTVSHQHLGASAPSAACAA